jgi:metal-responsive CopG/Arc/MetJ family transcriptional regulator
LPGALIEFLDREAKSTFRSRNAVIRDLVAREYLAKNGGDSL